MSEPTKEEKEFDEIFNKWLLGEKHTGWMKKQLQNTIKENYIHRSKLLEIVGEKAHESDGWENAKEESCCPGDDWADGYNRAKTEMREKIKEL